MSSKFISVAKNALIAYVATSVIGLNFAANMAIAADATSISNARSLGALVKGGVSPSYDDATGTITSSEGTVMVLQGAGADQSSKTAVYGDSSALGAVISSSATTLQGEASDAGNAYRTLRDGAILEHPDLSNDTIVKVGEAAYKDSFRDISLGGACVRSSVSTPTSTMTHIEELKYCTTSNPSASSCKVTRDLKRVYPLTVSSGEGSAAIDGNGTLQLVLGRIGDNYLSGNCTVYELNQTIKVHQPERITSAVLERVKWDDYIQVIVGGNYVFEGPDGPGVFPPEQGVAACERATEWDQNTNIDITSILKSVPPGGQIDIKVRVSVTGGGEAYGIVRVNYDPPKDLVIQDPPGCLDAINADPSLLGEGSGVTLGASIKDQASTEWFECLDAATSRNVSSVTGSFTISQNDYAYIGPLYPGEPSSPPAPLCFSAILRPIGTVVHECYKDAGGVEHCPVVDMAADVPSDCAALYSNPKCVFKRAECDSDSYNATNGQCSSVMNTFDCGSDQPIAGAVVSDTYSCSGDVACMGTECVNGFETEQNASFTKVATMAEITKNAGMDSDCASDPTTCRIFTGKLETCKNILGGLQNCCGVDAPTPSLSDYLTLTSVSYKLAKNTELGSDLISQGTGYWNSAQDAVKSVGSQASSAASEIARPFVSAFDSFTSTFAGGSSVSSGATAAADVAADVVTSVAAEGATSAGIAASVQGMTQGAMLWAKNFAGDILYGTAESIFVSSTEGLGVALNNAALNGMVGNIAAVASVIGWIYLAYQIINILVQLIWPCTEDEFKLASDKQLNMCHFIGTESKKKLGVTVSKTEKWCCFNSPLARIIHEQGRAQPQVNKPWGGYASTDCSGFTVAEFETIDFNKVDLSEWIAMLQLGGDSPTDPNVLAERYSDNASAGTRITGNGSLSANSTDRTKDLIKRTYGDDDNALDNRRESVRNKSWEDVRP